MKADNEQDLDGLETSGDEIGVSTRSKTKTNPAKKKPKKRPRDRKPKLSDHASKRAATFPESLQAEQLKATSDKNRRAALEKQRAERVRKVSNKSLILPL